MTARRLAPRLLISVFATTVCYGQTQGPTTTSAPAERLLRPDQVLDEVIVRIDAGDLEEANQLLDKIMRVAPKQDKIKLASGLLLSAAGRGAEAVSALEQYTLTPTGEKDYRGYAALGQIYRDSRTPRQARRNLEQARRWAPSEPVKGEYIRAGLVVDLAEVEALVNNKSRAIELLTEAAQSAPRDAKVQYRCAELLAKVDPKNTQAIRTGLDRATSALNQELAVDPYDLTKLRLLQSCHTLAQAMASAGLKKEDAATLMLAAHAMQDLADVSRRISLSQAREIVLRALKLDPSNPDWALFAADLEFQLGGTRDALERVDGVLKKDPGHKQARTLRERIRSSATDAAGTTAMP